MPQTLSQFFPLVGGLDVESAQLSRKPGQVMGGTNYESVTENGYERLGGFERLDGRPRPSDSTFLIIQAVTEFSGAIVGTDLNGQTSGATARLIGLRGTNQLALTKVVGTFSAGENIREGATVLGVYDAPADDYTSVDDNVYAALAEADYRADIGAVPGSGDIRGIAWLDTTCYAWRDNVGATALAIYKSSAAGWVLVALNEEIAFSNANTSVAEGDTLTQGGVTATVLRVVVQTGSLASGVNTGRLIISGRLGGNYVAGAATSTGGGALTLSGAQTAITLLPGGRLDLFNFNFTGSTAAERIYGADGVNRGFEFDGTVLVPINTGMVVDTPRHVYVHRNQLFYSFGGSVQHSGPGTPYVWTAVLGAAELAVGQDVTGFQGAPGDASTSALLIFSLTRSMVLYGSSSGDWKLTAFNDKVGAMRWSNQNIGSPIVMDAQGISAVAQSQQFGNFQRPPISNRIRRFLQNRVVTASVVNRAKARMRIFFADGEGVSITAIGDSLAFMPINYGKVISFACEANIAGVSRTFFGSTDGYVYEADRGRSFDSEEVIAWMKLAFNVVKSPGVKKRFRWADVEIKTQTATTLQVQGEYSLGAIDVGLTDVYSKDIAGLGGQYDLSDWDESYYDGPGQTSAKFRLDGTGTSLSLTFYTEAADELPHELQSCNVFYTPRRLDRG